MKHRAWVLAVAIAVTLCAIGRPVHAGEQRAWVKSVPDEATWKRYWKIAAPDELGQCISAVVQGTVGRGYRLIPNFPESVVPPELEAEVAKERARIDTFLSYAGTVEDFLTIAESA